MITPADLARFVHKSISRRTRHFAGGRDPSVVRGLEYGERVSILTDYTANLIDYLECVIDDAAPCRIDIATWAASQGDAGRLVLRRDAGHVTGARWIIDRGLRYRNGGAEVLASVVAMWGPDSVRECRLHAKIFVVDGGPRRRWAGQSSMNLNGNTRVENLDITRDDGLAGMYAEFFGMVFERVKPGENDTRDPFANPSEQPPARRMVIATPQDAIAARIAKNRRRSAAARMAAHG